MCRRVVCEPRINPDYVIMIMRKLSVLCLLLFASLMRVCAQDADSIRNISTAQMVDLGLSVNWAGYNIGASAPEQTGNYYSWGELETKTAFYRSRYAHCKDRVAQHIGDCISAGEHDVARKEWGGTWRMPTAAELEELRDSCQWSWTVHNGMDGCVVTGPNGNSIFLPAAGIFWGDELQSKGKEGWYWTGTLSDTDSECAKIAFFEFSQYTPEYLAVMDIVDPLTEAKRIGGQTVRAVCDKQ